MAQQGPHRFQIGLLTLLCVAAGCQGPTSRSDSSSIVSNTIPGTLHVPYAVERLVVVYPKTTNQLLLNAYTRLEGAAFQLKALRPSLRIIDRMDLHAVLEEQRFQVSGAVSDETAIRVGRLLGVDSVLVYRIDTPSFRDIFLARYYGTLLNYLISSKIIMVESGEVVFHNVVTTSIEVHETPWASSGYSSRVQFLDRSALDLGVDQTAADLLQAFHFQTGPSLNAATP